MSREDEPIRRALVVVNPIAGRGAAARCLPRLEEGLRTIGLSATIEATGASGDARAITGKLAPEHDLVVVVGGDGTLNEVINGLGVDRPLALFPVGTGNVMAKELRLPRKVERFCRMVAAGRQRAVDVGSAGGRRFVAFVGAGFDALVARRMAERRTGAIRMADYAGLILGSLARYHFPRISATVDHGEPVASRGFVLVSNVRSYGGPFVITPQALCDDGELDVCVLPRAGRVRYVWTMLGLIARLPSALVGTRHLRGRRVRLEGEGDVAYQVDGDPAGTLPVEVEVLDTKARFLVP